MMNHSEAWEAIRKIHPWLPSSREGWHQHDNGGGWIEDTAEVHKDVCVPQTVVVGARAKVGEGATIGEGATVGIMATVGITPIYIIGTGYFVCCAGPGLIQSGCIIKPMAWWLEFVERCAKEHSYTPDQQKEYRLHIEHVAAWMRLYGLDKVTTEHAEAKVEAAS